MKIQCTKVNEQQGLKKIIAHKGDIYAVFGKRLLKWDDDEWHTVYTYKRSILDALSVGDSIMVSLEQPWWQKMLNVFRYRGR